MRQVGRSHVFLEEGGDYQASSHADIRVKEINKVEGKKNKGAEGKSVMNEDESVKDLSRRERLQYQGQEGF